MIIEGEAKIVPRWEWRTFDASLNAIEVRIAAALEQVAAHTSAEIWTVLKTWSIGGISDSIGLDGFGAKACGGGQAFSISMIG